MATKYVPPHKRGSESKSPDFGGNNGNVSSGNNYGASNGTTNSYYSQSQQQPQQQRTNQFQQQTNYSSYPQSTYSQQSQQPQQQQQYSQYNSQYSQQSSQYSNGSFGTGSTTGSGFSSSMNSRFGMNGGGRGGYGQSSSNSYGRGGNMSTGGPSGSSMSSSMSSSSSSGSSRFYGNGGSNYSSGRGRGGGSRNYGGSSYNSYNNGGGGYQGGRQSGYQGNNYQSSRSSSRFTNRWNNQSSRSTEENLELEAELFSKEHEVVQGINFAQYDKIKVDISDDKIKPLSDFNDSELHSTLQNNVKLCGFNKPTPIQKWAVPCAGAGKDIMACAQTGSGKTAAFLLPIINGMLVKGVSLSHNNGNNSSYGSYGSSYIQVSPSCIVLSPTRELAIQIHQQARKFLYRTGFRSVVCYGGTDRGAEKRELRQGAEIVVATPGRLKDYVSSQTVLMSSVKYCVLDEADRMLDMGFLPQIKEIIYEMPKKENRNTFMFSATFPDAIQMMAQEFMRDDYVFIAIGKVGATNSFIKQKLVQVENNKKIHELIDLLPECKGLTLIFVEKKRDAAGVERQLINSGFNAVSIHGDRNQHERENALKLFRTARVPVLVATDVASRGLDIPNVLYVINYDLPNNIDSYVHRIGRTGRCGNEGNAISFVNESNKPILRDLLEKLKDSKQDIPQWFNEMVSRCCYDYGRNNNRYGNNNGYRGNNRYGGGGYRNNKSFGGRDFRRNNNNSGGKGNNNGGQQRSYFYDSGFGGNNDNNNNNNYNNNGGNNNSSNSNGMNGGGNYNSGSGGGGWNAPNDDSW